MSLAISAISPDFSAATGPAQEDERLAALNRYDVLDTPPEPAFDRITRMTRQIFGVPMATITFLDAHRQWFKSKQGLCTGETCRADAFCNLAIQQDQPLIISDTWRDDRFKGNPFVEGTPHLRFYAGAQLRDPDGHAIGTLCAMDTKPRTFNSDHIALLRDLADTVMSELELRLLAMRDSLTGALSRLAFREEAHRAVLLAVRHGYPLSCILLDLDHFKAVNDENGHGIGDLVLKSCVGACQTRLRQSDCLGRVGGEEFALLLPHTDISAAMRVAEKMRAAIAGLDIDGAEGPVRVTASFGIAELDRAAPEVDELLRRADSALYAAKNAGRSAGSVQVEDRRRRIVAALRNRSQTRHAARGRLSISDVLRRRVGALFQQVSRVPLIEFPLALEAISNRS